MNVNFEFCNCELKDWPWLHMTVLMLESRFNICIMKNVKNFRLTFIGHLKIVISFIMLKFLRLKGPFKVFKFKGKKKRMSLINAAHFLNSALYIFEVFSWRLCHSVVIVMFAYIVSCYVFAKLSQEKKLSRRLIRGF